MYEALQKFTPEAKIAKAARHFQDAIYLRAVRNDIDRILKLPYNLIVNNNKFLVWCYKVQTNPKWQDFLYWMSWIFMALIILEPNHSGKDNYYDTRDTEYHFLVGFESTILVLFAGELFMDIFHRTSDNVKTFWYKYIRNFKVLIKTIVFFLFFIDALIFYSSLPNVTFRFSRILRPCKENSWN